MGIRPALLASLVKSLLRITRVEVTTAEGKFWLDPASYLGQQILEHGVYEPTMVAVVKHFARPGGTFVDVGANEGYFSVVGALQVGSRGRVLAVEPQARVQTVLRRNLAINGCQQVALAPYAVSDRLGNATLHLTPGVNNSASSLIQPTRYPLWRQRVECLTLEEIVNRHAIDTCDLLKIDIEGWEYEAILGSRAIFRAGRAHAIALELHSTLLAKRGLDADQIIQFLAECGYQAVPDFPSLVLVHTSAN